MSVHFSSKKQDWTTPKDFYNKLDSEYGFVLDLACESHNCLSPNGFYFDKGINSLEQNWADISGWLWCNPPYGRELKHWVKKAFEESKKGAKVVMLIPARTDTSYWHDFIFGHAKIDFLRGRLKFGDGKNSAPFPSAVVVFDND